MPSTRTFLKNGFKVAVPYYTELLERFDGGCLPHDPAAHALWDYFTRASVVWEQWSDSINKLEGTVYNTPDFKQLFLSLAKMHDVDPEKMGQYWPLMHRQRFKLGLSLNAGLPAKYHFQGLKFP